MSKPDWNSSSSIHGGVLTDVPKPHIRKFPKKGMKRRVEVTITSWVGTSMGAVHYTPRVEEEANPLWDSNESGWRYCWDDLEKNGTEMQGPKFRSEKKAREWIQWALRAFDPKTHEFVYTRSGLLGEKPPKWFYARSGD